MAELTRAKALDIIHIVLKGFDQIADAQRSLYKKIMDDDISLWKIQPVLEGVMSTAMLTMTA